MANLPFSNIFYRKTRTAIGILSVAIEVTLVVVVIGLVHGTIDEAAGRITNVGADVIFQGPDSSPFVLLNSGVMSERMAEKIMAVPGVEYAAPLLINRVTSLKGNSKLVMIFGVKPDSYNQVGAGIQVVEGRTLEQPYDLVVDTVLAKSDNIAIGDSFKIMNRDFKVSGICRAGAGARMYLDMDTLQEATAQPDKVSAFFVNVDDESGIGEVAASLEKTFEGYKITALEGFAETMKENALGLKEFVRVLSFLAVLISFLVILLAMYTTVIERTREIGVLKALGAGKLYIIRLVMVESFIICFLGVLVGFVMSLVGRMWLLSFFPTLTVALLPQWFFIAALLGIGGGLMGALYPAFRAAKLDPVEALNFE
jgi:putative ABC transport system permease protein